MTGYPAMETRRSLWIPWALCGIFAVFLIANGTMLSVSSPVQVRAAK